MAIYVYTTEQMRALERAADAAGHSYAEMMEEAGAAVARVIHMLWPAEETRVVVLAGPGNNGGDGLVAARFLAQAGFSVTAFLWKRPEQDQQAEQARATGVAIFPAEEDLHRLQRAIERAHIVIDALLGTGLNRPIEGTLADILKIVQEEQKRSRQFDDAPLVWFTEDPSFSIKIPHRLSVVAVDIPTGINSDTGAVDPATVPADITITFAGPKVGQLLSPAATMQKAIIVADIGIPEAVKEASPAIAELVTPALAATLLPERSLLGHKGTFGRVLIIGGSVNYPGAPGLAAMAALRSGAGLITLGVPDLVAMALAPKQDLTNCTWLMLPHDLGALKPDAIKVLADELPAYDALVLGPGLGQEEMTFAFVWALLGLRAHVAPRPSGIGFIKEHATPEPEAPTLPPTVIDADALNALAAFDEEWAPRLPPNHFVLTPHPGEMARLCGVEPSYVQANRLQLAQQKAQEWQQTVVLKGAYTIIAAPDGHVSVSPFATPVLATAGTGDVLAGLIGGLLAQGLAPYDAARLGVFLHGLAGRLLADEYETDRGVLATEVAQWLTHAISALANIAGE